MLHNAERLTVKEVVQTAIVLIFAETESLKNIVSVQFETDLSWAKVAARKHKKSIWIEQRITQPLPVISNHYNQ
jgi:hypothetical protein